MERGGKGALVWDEEVWRWGPLVRGEEGGKGALVWDEEV